MFSWLFGKKKKKTQKKRKVSKTKGAKTQPGKKPAKPKSPYGDIQSLPVLKEQKPGNLRKDSDKVVEKMGGPEAIAMIIKSMLAEDKIKKK